MTPERDTQATLASECRDCIAQGKTAGDCPCPPLPPISELDQPYCTEDGDMMWLLKRPVTAAGPAVRHRTVAMREALGYGVADEWVDLRCRTVWMRFQHRDDWLGYGPGWGVEPVPADHPEAHEFWEVRHHGA